MFEIISLLATIAALIIVGGCALLLVTFLVLSGIEKFTPLRPINWLIDKAMRSH